ncbi:MAG: DegV family protein [Erysipelotrichales bacterium]|nr:DegV family protein [Erysipelotrichales bacterium]
MAKIKIVTDSSSGISQEEAKSLGIGVVPMPINIEGTDYLDGIDLFYDEAVEHIKNGDIFKTSQPLPKDVIAVWEEALEDHDYVVYFPISSGISGSCVNAYTIAQNYDGKVIVVDNKSVECLLRTNVLEAVEMAKAGYSAQEIKDIMEADFKDTFAVIIPESVETLKRGGRITPAVAALAGLLKICPLIKVSLGNLDLFDKVRTFKKAVNTAIEAVAHPELDKSEYHWLMLSVGFSKEEEEQFLETYRSVINVDDIKTYHFTPIVMGHTGNRTIGFGYTRKHHIEAK